MRLAVDGGALDSVVDTSFALATALAAMVFFTAALLPAIAAAAVPHPGFHIDLPVAEAGHDLSAHVGDAVTIEAATVTIPLRMQAIRNAAHCVSLEHRARTAGKHGMDGQRVAGTGRRARSSRRIRVAARRRGDRRQREPPAEVTMNAYAGNAVPVAIVRG